MIYAGEKCRSRGRSGEGRQQREEGRGPRAALLSSAVAPAAFLVDAYGMQWSAETQFLKGCKLTFMLLTAKVCLPQLQSRTWVDAC